MQVDATPFKQWFEQHYNLSLAKAKTKDEKLAEKEEFKFPEVKAKVEARRQKLDLDQLLRDQFPTGRILARIASRPGQVGRADGYILEGPELHFYLRKIQQKKSK